MIEKDMPISYLDPMHILIGDQRHYCTGPRMHVKSTGKIKNFQLYQDFLIHPITKNSQILGLVNIPSDYKLADLNSLQLMTFSEPDSEA